MYDPDNSVNEYASQEIFTQEKFVYLYYQAILMLDQLYNAGIAHGGITSTNLKISDDYTFCMTDFSIASVIPGFTSLTEEQ